MNKKIIFIIIIIILVAGFVGYGFFVKKDANGFVIANWRFGISKPRFAIEKVARGTVSQEVSETGIVKVSEEMNLGFKTAGRIEKIYVKIGDKVAKGQDLVKLDSTQLYFQLQEAQAALEVAQAQKANTDVSLNSARQNLEDVRSDAEKDLNTAYEDAIDALNDSYLKIYNSFTFVSYLNRTYFQRGDQDSVNMVINRDLINVHLNEAEVYINKAKNSGSQGDTDTALLKVKEELLSVKKNLETIRDIIETPVYRDLVSSIDRSSLDTHKSNINTAYNNIVGAIQNISTVKITNTTNINNAQAGVAEIESQLSETAEGSGLYDAKIKQAQAQVALLQSQVQDAVLKSPTSGQITAVDKKEGETVAATQPIISFLPSDPFQIKADIYEEDIVKIKVGNPVDIVFAAFPDKTFKGQVVSINPAEKVIDGVVYYEITVDFKENIEGLKNGMTADIVIKTAEKENALIIPRGAVEKINNKEIVKVIKNGKTEEREIEIGLRGNDFFEVISGLTEGEEIITGKKQ